MTHEYLRQEAQKALQEERVQFEVQRAEKERQFALLQRRLREEKEHFDEERSLAEVIITTLRQKLTEEREKTAALHKALEESQDELHKRIEDENKKRYCPFGPSLSPSLPLALTVFSFLTLSQNLILTHY